MTIGIKNRLFPTLQFSLNILLTNLFGYRFIFILFFLPNSRIDVYNIQCAKILSQINRFSISCRTLAEIIRIYGPLRRIPSAYMPRVPKDHFINEANMEPFDMLFLLITSGSTRCWQGNLHIENLTC
jgi:hypothetical protein